MACTYLHECDSLARLDVVGFRHHDNLSLDFNRVPWPELTRLYFHGAPARRGGRPSSDATPHGPAYHDLASIVTRGRMDHHRCAAALCPHCSAAFLFLFSMFFFLPRPSQLQLKPARERQGRHRRVIPTACVCLIFSKCDPSNSALQETLVRTRGRGPPTHRPKGSYTCALRAHSSHRPPSHKYYSPTPATLPAPFVFLILRRISSMEHRTGQSSRSNFSRSSACRVGAARNVASGGTIT